MIPPFVCYVSHFPLDFLVEADSLSCYLLMDAYSEVSCTLVTGTGSLNQDITFPQDKIEREVCVEMQFGLYMILIHFQHL